MKKSSKYHLNLFLSIVAMLLLSACVSRDDSELRLQVEEILARPPGRIEPLPEVQFYEAYSYQSADKTSPFEWYLKTREEQLVEEGSGLSKEQEREIYQRNKEELEQFDLEALQLVGWISQDEESINDFGDSELYGIIVDSNSSIHRVGVGNYLGKDFGKVTEIQQDRIILREIYQDSSGRWQERDAQLVLADEEQQ